VIASDIPLLVPHHSVCVAATLLAASCCFGLGLFCTWLHSRRFILVLLMPRTWSPSPSPNADGAEGARETYFFFSDRLVTSPYSVHLVALWGMRCVARSMGSTPRARLLLLHLFLNDSDRTIEAISGNERSVSDNSNLSTITNTNISDDARWKNIHIDFTNVV